MKYLFCCIIIWFCIPYLYAKNAKDTTLYVMPEVEVSGARIISRTSLISSPYSLIDSAEIERSAPMQVSEILNEVPGLYIKDYGGLSGLKTVSLRGTSAQQTLVMIDGMKLNSAQNGISDLSSLPVSLLESVEVVRGGASAVFGGNAIGGVINFNMRDVDYQNRLKGRIGFGSFERTMLSLSGSLKVDSISAVSGVYQYSASAGGYPFKINHFGREQEIERKNSDFSSHALSTAYSVSIEDWKAHIRFLGFTSERGIPGPAVKNNYSSKARAVQNDAVMVLSAGKDFGSEQRLFLGVMTNFNEYEYSDPFGRAGGIEDIFINRGVQIQADYRNKIADIVINTFIEPSFYELRGDMLSPEVNRYVNRFSIGAGFRAEKKMIVFNKYDYLSTLAALRLDAISDINPAISPMLGFQTYLSDLNLTMNAQYSYNFRAPGFNEMYYYNYGSENLKPERAHSVNIGAGWQPFDNHFYELNLFAILTEDQIAAYPKRPDAWSAMNIGRVFTRGFEFSASPRFFDQKLGISFSYTRQLAGDESESSLTNGKKIPYIPEEMLHCSAEFDFGIFTISSSVFYSSYRYAMVDNNYNSIIPSYVILDAGISKEQELYGYVLIFKFKTKNILNESYEIIKNYPMPGINFYGELMIKI